MMLLEQMMSRHKITKKIFIGACIAFHVRSLMLAELDAAQLQADEANKERLAELKVAVEAGTFDDAAAACCTIPDSFLVQLRESLPKPSPPVQPEEPSQIEVPAKHRLCVCLKPLRLTLWIVVIIGTDSCCITKGCSNGDRNH